MRDALIGGLVKAAVYSVAFLSVPAGYKIAIVVMDTPPTVNMQFAPEEVPGPTRIDRAKN